MITVRNFMFQLRSLCYLLSYNQIRFDAHCYLIHFTITKHFLEHFILIPVTRVSQGLYLKLAVLSKPILEVETLVSMEQAFI